MSDRIIEINPSLEEKIQGTLTETSATGAEDIDWTANILERFTLTVPVTFADANFPAIGFTKVKDLMITGEHAIAWPATYTKSPKSDNYDGTKWNMVTLKITRNNGVDPVEVYYFIENMS